MEPISNRRPAGESVTAAAAAVRAGRVSLPATAVEPSSPAMPIRVRLDLQRRARYNLRRHVVRAAARFGVLLIADLGSFGVMRALLRAVRGHAVLGEWVARWVGAVLPPGILNGWQYAVALLLALFILGCYGAGDQRRDVRRLFAACALATALPLWMTIWSRGLDVVLVQYSLTTVLVWAGLVVERLVVDRVVAWVRPPARHAVRTIFVGPAEACATAMGSPAFRAPGDFRSAGFVDVRLPPAPDSLGQIADFPKLLRDSGAEAVVVCGHVGDARFREVVDLALAAGCQVLAVPRAVGLAGVQPSLVWRRHQPLIELTTPSLRGGQLVLKRALDLAGASFGLVLAAPVFALMAILIRLDSPGPVFFRQERVGWGGRRFRMIKFRTMMAGAEDRRDELLGQSIYRDARLFKVPSDPRVTRLGRWLRRASLDEVPQLLNVLRGDMSLVGPRPPIPSEVELYEAHQYARFDVKPGITGPWQVSGRNQVTDFERVIALETEYIREWSLWKDLAILGRTFVVVLKMQGAH